MERVYGNRVPAVVLGPGMKVDVIRDGGWTYADEREPHVSEEVEVALTDWGFLGRPVTIGHWGEWKGRAYAWRPAPVPPPVRRAGPVEPDIPQRAPSPAAQYRELMRGRPDGDPAKGERPLTYAEVAALEGLE
ncbi:MAG TPA: hypothetical protein VLT87_11090 [Thermoanaerobaculia bacterium]|nr:hypothetical protein [Thermoanaerobaculia bacterium]